MVEAMVTEIDGWHADLRVILPAAQHFRYWVEARQLSASTCAGCWRGTNQSWAAIDAQLVFDAAGRASGSGRKTKADEGPCR